MTTLHIRWIFAHVPTGSDWLLGFCILLIYTLVAVPFGIWQGFLEWSLISSRSTAIRVIVSSLITPALLEEAFFRVILLPHPSENATLKYIVIRATIALSLFVIYHPLNGLTFFPQGRPTFFDPIFLILAALLGLACTVGYLLTGSIWIPVVTHWLAVIVWLLCFGGIYRLKFLER